MAEIVVLTADPDNNPLNPWLAKEGTVRFSDKPYPSALAGECPELIIVDTPLGDSFGDEVACRLAQETTASVMLIVEKEQVSRYASLSARGIFVAVSPPDDLFLPTVRIARIAHRRVAGVQDENRQLQKEIEELRMVNRAKAVLMQVLKLSEPQAHRYIEKQAMDRRITRREVAKNILNTYDHR